MDSEVEEGLGWIFFRLTFPSFCLARDLVCTKDEVFTVLSNGDFKLFTTATPVCQSIVVLFILRDFSEWCSWPNLDLS